MRHLSVAENLQSRKSRNAKFVTGGLINGAVDLDEGNWRIVGLQLGGRFLIFGGHSLAMSTPWSVELDQGDLVLLDAVIPGGICVDDHIISRKYGKKEQRSHECQSHDYLKNGKLIFQRNQLKHDS